MREPAKARISGKSLDRLIVELKESDDFTRAGIIERLLASPSREMVERVAELLYDNKNTSLRMDALDIIKKTGNHAIEAVVQLLYHENEDIRVYGCEALGSLKNPACLPHLFEKINEDNENVRNAAVVTLGEFDDPRAVDILLDVLNQEEWVAFSAIYSLGKIGDRRAVPALMDAFKNRGEELSLAACEALLSFRDERILGELVGFIKDLDPAKKDIFIRIIIEQGDVRIFQRLVKVMAADLFQHLQCYLKVEKRKPLKVIELLIHFRHPDSARAMLDTLKEMDPDADSYDHVLQLFMELKDVWTRNAEEYLAREEYRLPMVRACAYVDHKIDEKFLMEIFRSSSLETKREIMMQLPRIFGGNGCGIIREAMRDADGHIQAEAVAIAGTMAIRDLTPDVLAIAKKGFADVRTKAMLALLRLDRSLAVSTIDKFVTKGGADDKRVYLAVCRNLDRETNFPFLERLIGDGDERVRQMAIRVVGDFLDDHRYLDLFGTVLKGGDVPNEVLKVIGEKRLSAFKDP